jgi:hypothetical protein
MGRNDAFHPKRLNFSPPEVEEQKAKIREEFGGDGSEVGLNYDEHVAQVTELIAKIADVFETKEYSATVALDALETILRGGVAVSFGDEAADMLNSYLHKFHANLAMLQIISAIGERVRTTGAGAGKDNLADLLKELEDAAGKPKKES